MRPDIQEQGGALSGHRAPPGKRPKGNRWNCAVGEWELKRNGKSKTIKHEGCEDKARKQCEAEDDYVEMSKCVPL